MRNALHHGVESPADREKDGKNPIAHIELEAKTMGASLVLDIKDDGRGIDWEAIRERAQARGLDATTAEDLREALFADGLSSAEQVSDIAGRGVGMGALRAAAVQLEGTCRVMSSLGEGTNLRFVFPLSALGKAYRNPLKDLLSRDVG